MKKANKIFIAASMLLLLSSSLFADPPKKTVDASLSVVEALQNSFRSISNTMLPAVVEVDITETEVCGVTARGIDLYRGLCRHRRIFCNG